MKVICIDPEAWPDTSIIRYNDGVLKLGQTYEVIDVELEEGYIWYEVDVDKGWQYWENCFARCSEIDERKLLAQRFKQKVKSFITQLK